ncbi:MULTISPECIES: golvesin C-terminal-like domain-containing protein [Paenibacillus]|uniref:golvesin C-terminal-like domain-containing protein n=1 Tax=Paenibacillus TaxID=44249 RepID=UPI0022B93DFF|nr:GDSL-type esterase/lipase family protein [Paenibacillus caseinilyticus]MCZ8520112.1 GDSL-type esterase/lipase family protein [Paenibacillus caseinilyticus]
MPPEPVIISVGEAGYSEMGAWTASSSLTSYNGTQTKYTQTVGNTATWSKYAPETGNYDIEVWFPISAASASLVEYIISTPYGDWVRTADQTSNGGGWYKIATVTAQQGAGITVTLTAKTAGANTRAGSVRFVFTAAAAEPTGTASAGQDTTTVKVILNQVGFDLGEAKRATVTNVPDGTPFTVKRVSDGSPLFPGNVIGGVADFTGFDPLALHSTLYYVECNGVKSDNFMIAKFLMQRTTAKIMLDFMVQSRSDIWSPGENSVLTRDGHHFDFPLSSIYFLYCANPAYYERLPRGVYRVADTEFAELRLQNEPDIVWLMKFYAYKMYDLVVNKGKQLHAMTKGELAFFLHLYPEISQYVTPAFYQQIRDLAVSQWSVPTVSADMQKYDAGTSTDNNLLATQSVIGDIKGAQPPGYAIMPNILMWEVAQRDGLANPQQYLDAAINNAAWLVNSVDLSDPRYTKGQRMSEHITIPSLAYLLEVHPDKAPAGTKAKIAAWIDRMIKRSNNMWDLRKYADPAAGDGLDQWTGGLIVYNEPGNIAGFQGCALAAIRVAGTPEQKARMLAIAVAHNDQVLGRNPLNVAFSYSAVTEIPGVERGWPVQYKDTGAGDLKWVVGSLEGSPKESAYPFAPAAPPQYTEGWTSHNGPWNKSRAYADASKIEVKVVNSFGAEISQAPAGTAVFVRLKAPLNSNPEAIETAAVQAVTNTGTKINITLTEESADDYYFRGSFVVPEGINFFDVSYGFSLFRQSARVTAAQTTGPSERTGLNMGIGRWRPFSNGGGSVPAVKKWLAVDVVWIGNSIWAGQGLTAAQKFIAQLSEATGMNSTVHGFPGEAWAHTGSGTDTSILSRRATFKKGAKMYVMYSGGNDNNKDIDLGDITDRLNTTFSGSINLMIDWVEANAPGAIIVMAISLPRNGPPTGVITSTTKNLKGFSLMDYNNRAREIAEARGCYIWDLFGIWKKSEIIPKTQDGVHPSPSGATQIAQNGVGFFNSLEVPATAPAGDTTAPIKPATPTLGSKTSTQVVINWTAVADNAGGSGVNAYQVFRNGTLRTTLGIATTFIDTGLSPNTAYTYAIKARDAANNYSPISDNLSVTTDPAAQGDTTPPNTPAAPTLGSKSHNSVTINWTVTSDNTGGVGVTQYEVHRNGTLLTTVPSSTLAYTDSTVQPATDYTYAIKAKDGGGYTSAASAALSVRTDDAPAGGSRVEIAKHNFNANSGATNLAALTLETGQQWTVPVGAAAVGGTGSICAYFSSSVANSVAVFDGGVSDGKYELKFPNPGGTNKPNGGRNVFRYVDKDNYWFTENSDTAGLRLFLRQGAPGAGANTPMFTGTGPNTADGCVVRVELVGPSISVYYNDVLVETITNTTHQTATKYGFGTAQQVARFDDVLLYTGP